MDTVHEKVVLVTGSSRGIGAATAKLFAQHGAKVVVHGRDETALADVHAEIVRAGGKAMPMVADVTKFTEIEAMRRQIEQEFGPIEILVANAGGSYTMPGPLEQISEDGWHASLNGNLTATFLTIKSILPGMKERKRGCIITISSAAGRTPHPQAPIPYAAAKAGIQMLTQVVAAQAGPFGIRANCVAPETILTERNKERIPAAQQQNSWTDTRCGAWARPRTSPGRHSSWRPRKRHGSPASSWTLPAGRSWCSCPIVRRRQCDLTPDLRRSPPRTSELSSEKLTPRCVLSSKVIRLSEIREHCKHQTIGEPSSKRSRGAMEGVAMRLVQAVLIVACVLGLVSGPWAGSVALAQPASAGVTREGTIVSIDRQAESFVMSTPNMSSREVTVLAQKFTEFSVTRQGAVVPASFASLAIGDRVVVHMLMLASGRAVAVTTHVVSRAPAPAATRSAPAPTKGSAQQTGAAPSRSGTSGSPSRTGSSGSTGSGVSIDATANGSAGSGLSVNASGSGSSAGSGLSVNASGSGSSGGSGLSVNGAASSSSAGSGVSVSAAGSSSSSGIGLSVGANGSGSSTGNGVSVDASGRGSAGGSGPSAGANASGSAGNGGVSAGASASGGGRSAGADASAGSGGVSVNTR